MRGGQNEVSEAQLRELQTSIETELDCILATKHQTKENAIALEDRLPSEEIHDRNWHLIQDSDICIFEISNPSLGVGAEIADALHLSKPVLALWSGKIDETKISAYIRGKKDSKHTDNFSIEKYANTKEALSLISALLEKGNN